MKGFLPPIFVLFLSLITFPAFAQTTLPATVTTGNVVVGKPVAPVTKSPLLTPRPCIVRPACLDAKPRCMIAEPIEGFCKTTPTPTMSVTPTPMHCGGFIKNAPSCPPGYVCHLNKIADTGGTCVLILPSPVPTQAAAVVTETPAKASFAVSVVTNVFQFFHNIFFKK